MERKSAIVLAALVFSFFAALGLAARYGGGTSGTKGSPQAVKKLRAKPGTMRENARAIVSSVPSKKSESPGGGGAGGSGGAGRDKPLEIWGRLDSPSSGPPEERSEAARVADEALGAASAEEGIERVLASLTGVEGVAEASRLYGALGSLYARQDPVDVALAQQAFGRAVASARTTEEREEAVCRQVKALIRLGRNGPALDALAGWAVGEGVLTARRLEMGVMLGILYEEAGDSQKALQAYEDTMDWAIGTEERANAEIANVFRQAGLRLARLYRRLELPREAARVSRRAKAWLGD